MDAARRHRAIASPGWLPSRRPASLAAARCFDLFEEITMVCGAYAGPKEAVELPWQVAPVFDLAQRAGASVRLGGPFFHEGRGRQMPTQRSMTRALLVAAFAGLGFGLLSWLAGNAVLAGWLWAAGTLPVVIALLASIVRKFLSGRLGVDVVAF